MQDSRYEADVTKFLKALLHNVLNHIIFSSSFSVLFMKRQIAFCEWMNGIAAESILEKSQKALYIDKQDAYFTPRIYQNRYVG